MHVYGITVNKKQLIPFFILFFCQYAIKYLNIILIIKKTCKVTPFKSNFCNQFVLTDLGYWMGQCEWHGLDLVQVIIDRDLVSQKNSTRWHPLLPIDLKSSLWTGFFSVGWPRAFRADGFLVRGCQPLEGLWPLSKRDVLYHCGLQCISLQGLPGKKKDSVALVGSGWDVAVCRRLSVFKLYLCDQFLECAASAREVDKVVKRFLRN